MVELLIPMALRPRQSYGAPTNLLPAQYRNNTVVLRSKSDVDVLSQIFGGRSGKPRQEIIIVGPDGRTPILVTGLGVTEVSELQDTVQEAMERSEERVKKTGSVIPFDKYRERRGLPSNKEFDTLLREAIYERIKQHKANPRTDPARDPMSKQFAKGQSMVTVPALSYKEK